MSRWRILLVLATVALFVLFLWRLASSDPTEPEPASAETTTTATEHSGDSADEGLSVPPQIYEDALPEIPEDRWQYIQELESRRVEVEVPEPPATEPHILQCGSFRSTADAESLRAQIAFQGQAAQVEAVETAGGLWHRVILGPYPNRREAQRINNQLQRGAIYGCQLRPSPASD